MPNASEFQNSQSVICGLHMDRCIVLITQYQAPEPYSILIEHNYFT